MCVRVCVCVCVCMCFCMRVHVCVCACVCYTLFFMDQHMHCTEADSTTHVFLFYVLIYYSIIIISYNPSMLNDAIVSDNL